MKRLILHSLLLAALACRAGIDYSDIVRWGLLRKTATNGWEVGGHAAFLTAESDTAALNALSAFGATNRVTVLWESDTAWWTVTANGLTRWVMAPTDTELVVSGAGSEICNGVYTRVNPYSYYGYAVLYTNSVTGCFIQNYMDEIYLADASNQRHYTWSPCAPPFVEYALQPVDYGSAPGPVCAFNTVPSPTHYILDNAEGRLLSSLQNGSGFTTQTVHVVAGAVTTNCFYAP